MHRLLRNSGLHPVQRLVAAPVASVAPLFPAAPEEHPPMISDRYEDHGAVGGGKADDLDAIVEAQAFANGHGLAARGNFDAICYLGGRVGRTASRPTPTSARPGS